MVDFRNLNYNDYIGVSGEHITIARFRAYNGHQIAVSIQGVNNDDIVDNWRWIDPSELYYISLDKTILSFLGFTTDTVIYSIDDFMITSNFTIYFRTLASGYVKKVTYIHELQQKFRALTNKELVLNENY